MPAPKLIASKVKHIVVHCSDSPPKVKVDARVIDRWHRERGFLGIGYHFVILRNGTVEKGRPITEIGAHCVEVNASSIGICLAGGRSDKGAAVADYTDEQYVALAQVLREMLIEFPRAQIVGHCDLTKAKTCPNFDVAAWWHATVASPEVDA